MFKTTTKTTILALIGAATTVHAAEISVPGDYFTLTAAITGAASGDTINLDAGFFPEVVTVNKHLTIRGAGVGSTIIEGQGLDAVFTVTGNVDLTIENLTIQGGGNNTYGGGIDALASNVDLIITDVEIKNPNHSLGGVGVGGAIYINQGTLTAERLRCSDNTAIRGGAIYLNSSTTNLTDCEFVSNEAIGGAANQGEGGAIWASSGFLTINDCLFELNDAAQYGGAIGLVSGNTCRVSTSVFLDNTSPRGGAFDSDVNTLYVENSVFARNNAGLYGGVVYSQNKAYFLNCTMYENYGANGAFECVGAGDVDILNCVVVDAIGDSYGGSGTFTARHSMFPEAPVAQDTNGNFSGDPMFVNTGGNDFRIVSGSPAIDAGNSLGNVGGMQVIFYTGDIDGNVRNLDDTGTLNIGVAAWELCIDLGAYEYQPTGTGSACIGDLTTQGAAQGEPGFGVPDGNATGADLQFFVNAWIMGCP